MDVPRCERGTILLVVAGLLSLGLVAAFAAGLAGNPARLARDRASDRALAAAQEALIAYATGRAIDAAVGPGYLPCPDLDDDGWAEATCGSQSGHTGQAQRLGRLPWKTLGIDDLRDGHGERLWYAVSSKHKGLLNCGPNAACVDMGPDAALGTLTVRDASGTVVHDGRIDDARRAGAGGAAAVVIAPGPPLERREDLAGTVRRMQARETRAQQLEPANYLDKAPGAAFGGEDNATFVDRNDAAGRVLNGDGFIRGPVRLADGTLAVNDRVAAIGYDDLMPRVMRRVANEVAQCLRAHPSTPAPACRQGMPDAGGAWSAEAGARFGRVPAASLEACGLAQPGADPGWWRAWRLHVFYARGVRPVDAGGRSAGGARDFAVLVAGAALGAQSHEAGSEPDPAQWLEPPHDALARLDATPACSGLPPPRPCAPATCDRVVAAPRDPGRNDVVVLSP
jgi:hypothetical protein